MTLFDRAGTAVSQVPLPDVPLLPESEREVAIPVIDAAKPLAAGEYRVEVQHRRRHAGPDRRRNDAQGPQVDPMRPVLCGLAAASVVLHASIARGTAGQGPDLRRRPGRRRQPGARRRREHASSRISASRGFSPASGSAPSRSSCAAARRGDRLHLGRNYAALRDLKTRRLSLDVRSRRRVFHPRASANTASRTSRHRR